MEWHSWHSGDGGFPQIEKKLTEIGFQIIKSSPHQKAVGRDGEVGLFLAQNLNFQNWRIMEKHLEEKMNSPPFFIRSIDPTHLNFGQNSDGFEILVFHLFYRSSTERVNGLP